jgi:hypothetical protein
VKRARWIWATLAGLVAIAAGLRLNGHATSPALNADEYDWAWSGLTLWSRGVPIGWTDLWSSYPSNHLISWQGHTYPLVTPYLDHPPLFSLIVGGVSSLTGARGLTDVSLGTIRLVPIALSLVAIVLIFVLMRSTLGQLPAAITVGLLALSSTVISLDRLTESESLLAVLMLIALLALKSFDEDGNRRALVVMVVACTLAPLVKVPGISVGLACTVILVSRGRLREAGVPLALAGAGLVGFALYGALLDWPLFVHVWQAQAARHHGLNAGYELLRGGLGDYWWGLGIVGLGALLLRTDRRGDWLVLPAIAYVVVITLAAAPDLAARYDWYRIVIYPLVYAGAGWVLAQVVTAVLSLFAPPQEHAGEIARRSVVVLELKLVAGRALKVLRGVDKPTVASP